jgi:hypothetical protein
MNIEEESYSKALKEADRSLRTFICPKAIEVCLVKAR